jgi:hypothetical protein
MRKQSDKFCTVESRKNTPGIPGKSLGAGFAPAPVPSSGIWTIFEGGVESEVNNTRVVRELKNKHVHQTDSATVPKQTLGFTFTRAMSHPDPKKPGLSAEEVNILTKEDILEVLKPYRPPTKYSSRKALLVEHVLTLEHPAVLTAVERAIAERKERRTITEQNRKEASRIYQQERSARRRIEEGVQPIPTDTNLFMTPISEEERRACHRRYRKLTSNEALRQEVCIICARGVSASVGKRVEIADIPNQHLLKPNHYHYAMQADMRQNMLLWTRGIKPQEDGRESGFACQQCLTNLGNKRQPRYSLANDLWIGEIPDCLANLTIAEELLIARAHPRCSVFKLFPRKGWAGIDPSTLQRGMRGNVTSYEMNVKDVASMVEGRLLPHPLSLLPNLIAVCIIGKGRISKNVLKHILKVRRSHLRAALGWLKEHNPCHRDIEISEERLQAIPEDDVPDEIESICRQETNEEVAERERDGYVPEHDTEGGRRY